ncbi:MAG: ATP phosphoribosyltransferase regulatory subunit [Actinomycetaceae bacterium]|nr:ATP phosphoribosyltransferase regulatory subunit [Actinomycetaceae bacterium]
MSKQISPPRGMRDITPADKRKRDYVLNTILDTYRAHGFTAIETPAVEQLKRLRSNQGGENESMLFEILRRGLDPKTPLSPQEACDLGLRYDLTLPLTRFYATNQAQLPPVFRALQTGPVWRAERPQKGRYRQFTQCDIDIIGDATPVAEVDLLLSTIAALTALGMKDSIRLLINDRRILTDMLAAVGIAPEAGTKTFIILDKLHKIGRDAVVEELISAQLCNTDQAHALLDSLGSDDPDNDPVATGSFTVGTTELDLYDIPAIVNAVRAVNADIEIVFDPTMVRGMGYYTGTIFEIEHRDFASSVAGGGRYDGVIGKWLGRDVPACGFSIGFERIIDLLPDDFAPVTGMRIAVAYPKDADIADVMRQRAALQSGVFPDADAPDSPAPGSADAIEVVALVPQPRKVKATFLQGLVEQGFTHIVRQDFDGNWQPPRPLKD